MAPPTQFTIPQISDDGKEANHEIQVEIEEEQLSQECKELILNLPREKVWRTPYLYLYQGFWCQPTEILAISTFQKHFQAKDTDVLIATVPKSGTTWLKALTFATLNRNNHSPTSENHPLLKSNPHNLVPFFEYTLYSTKENVPDLSHLPEPRMFGTHVPFASLPTRIVRDTKTKIVYICRNPFDTFLSSWFFCNKIKPKSSPDMPIEEAFGMFCKGVVGFGPFWDHMLGYWKESIERPEKVLFLKYEDLKEDVNLQLKRVATFLGCPFTLEEENCGVVESIVKLCSFENMKDLEVNKNGKFGRNFENKFLFRKGEIGDWVNYFTPSMVEKLSKVMEEKLHGSGLSFRLHLDSVVSEAETETKLKK
ncbi:Cytosolic sulfotransferase 15 [Stylosanthes scabra]|uniref:Sulfotransferase n=1 Tax=Stylosanthes scabra TaxID=79078 RepID=A0ABU6VBM6_9FABA|nr:Cytosolic sulfotransferase 15 [Stylosanthes scabra]